MGIIKTCKLVYEYIRRDENNEIAEKLQAIKGVDIDIEERLREIHAGQAHERPFLPDGWYRLGWRYGYEG